MYIRDLKIGQKFVLTGKSTVMEVTGISYEPGLPCVISYRLPGEHLSSSFYLAGLSTCVLIGD